MRPVRSAFLLLVVLLLATAPRPAKAGGVVTDCSDYNAPGGLGAAVATSGVVTFACSGTIVVPAEIEVLASNSPLTIDGTGQSVTLSGGGASRVLRVAANGVLTLRNLTVRDGRFIQGGAIGVVSGLGRATIDGVRFVNNTGTIEGGAIWSSGSVTVTHSHFENNVSGLLPTNAGMGGAIYINANSAFTTTISSSTIVSNTAVADTGAGGGVMVRNGTVKIVNSTIVSNTAGEGGGLSIQFPFASLQVINSTLAANTAITNGQTAQHTGGILQFFNSLIAGDAPRCTGAVAAISSFESGAAPPSCGASLVTGAALALGALGENGGPTMTIPLGVLSVARGTGDPNVCATSPVNAVDQRGARRPAGSCDLGAFQAGASPIADAVSPTQTTALTPTTLTITGTHFISGSAVRWNGAPVASTVVNSTTITATVPGSLVTPSGPASVTVRYPSPDSVDSSPLVVTVLKAGQSIDFPALPDRGFAQSPAPLTATASSGLPVAFSSQTPAICSVSGAQATLLAVGACTVAANQPGDGSYEAAAQQTRTFQVLAEVPTATPTATSTLPAGATATPTATPPPGSTATPTPTTFPPAGATVTPTVTPTATPTTGTRPAGNASIALPGLFLREPLGE
jgi:hypothetical protein